MVHKIESTRFGLIEVAEDKMIEFPLGLPGFDSRRFTLLHPEADDGSGPKYFILQSLDEADVAFYIVDPAVFGFSYEITLDDAVSEAMGLSDPADAAVMVMLSRDDDNAPLRANLKAPLVLNLGKRRGVQHIFERLDYTV